LAGNGQVLAAAGALWLLLMPTGLKADAPSVSVVGAYSNRVITDQQARGYGIQLWQEGTHYFGFFLSAAGLADDIPLGILENLRYDPAAKTLSFKARMSVGTATMDGDNWVPTRDIYQFDGTLYPDQISGSLIHINALQPDRPAKHEEVKLYRSRTEEAALPVFKSYAQWSELARKLLAARGPKW
jgi:hypothetical protein